MDLRLYSGGLSLFGDLAADEYLWTGPNSTICES